MFGPIRKLLFLSLLFVLSCSETTTKSDAQTICANTPLISNEKFWASIDGKPIVNCGFDECFPKSIDASIPCDVRCLFTTAGFGLPEAVSRAFEGKKARGQNNRPNFIVAYGPPASGKSSILQILQKNLPDEFQGLDASTVLVDVDDIFQGGEVGLAYNQYKKALISRADSPEKRELYTQRLYVYYRWVADQISDDILNEAIAGRFNILWETTGATDWPARQIARTKNYDYNSVVVYPLVDAKILVERALKRAQEDGQEPLPPDQIRNTVDLAQKNLVQLLPVNASLERESCPGTGQNEAEKCRAHRVILIDNTGEKGQETVSFDSKRPLKTCDRLQKTERSVQFQEPLKNAITVFSKCKL